MANQITSASQAQPSALAPQPGTDGEEDIQAMLDALAEAPAKPVAEEEPPEAEQAQAAPVEPQLPVGSATVPQEEFVPQGPEPDDASDPSLEAMFDELANAPYTDEGLAIGGEATAYGSMPEMKPTPDLSQFKESALGYVDRATFSFAQTAHEQEQFLKGLPGITNVRRVGDDNWLVFNGEKDMIVDPEGFEFGDLLDLTRPAMETAIAVGIEGSALAASGAVTVGTGGLGTPALVGTAAAAGAVGGTVAAMVGDVVQAGLLGIPIDPKRNLLAEYGMATTLSGLLAGLGGYLGRRLAQNKVSREMHEKFAGDAALKAKEHLAAIEEIEATLAREGITTKLGVTDINGDEIVTSFEAIGTVSVEGREITKILNSTNQAKTLHGRLVDQYMQVYDSIIEVVTNGKARKVKDLNNIVDVDQQVARKLDDITTSQATKERRLITDAKKKVSTANKGKAMPSTDLDDYMQSLELKTGFKLDENAVRRLNEAPPGMAGTGIQGREQTFSEYLRSMDIEQFSQAMGFHNTSSRVGKYKDKLTKLAALTEINAAKSGEVKALSMRQIESLVNEANFMARTAKSDPDKTLVDTVEDLAKALRMSRREVIGGALREGKGQLGAQEAKLFQDTMFDMADTIDLIDRFKKYLVKSDTASTSAFIKEVTKNPSSQSVEALHVLEAFLSRSQGGHQVWDQIAGGMMDEALRTATKSASTPAKFSAIIKALEAYPIDMRRMVFKNAHLKLSDFQKFLAFADKAEKIAEKGMTAVEEKTFWNNLTLLASPFLNQRIHASMNVWNLIAGGRPKIMELVTTKGLEEYAATGTLQQRKVAAFLHRHLLISGKDKGGILNAKRHERLRKKMTLPRQMTDTAIREENR